MSDLKSKLPSLNELGKMAGTMYHAIKGGVVDVIAEYKKNHPADVKTETPESKPVAKEEKAVEPKAPTAKKEKDEKSE